MKTKVLSTLVLMASIIATSTQAANGPSYDYLDVGYSAVTVDILDREIEADAFGFGASISIAPNVAFTATAGITDYDSIDGVYIDDATQTLGVTLHAPLGNTTDLYGNFSVVFSDVEVSYGLSTATTDDTGSAFSGGIRHLADNAVELHAGFHRVDIWDDTSTTMHAGVRLYATRTLSFGASYSVNDDADALNFGLRVDLR